MKSILLDKRGRQESNKIYEQHEQHEQHGKH